MYGRIYGFLNKLAAIKMAPALTLSRDTTGGSREAIKIAIYRFRLFLDYGASLPINGEHPISILPDPVCFSYFELRDGYVFLLFRFDLLNRHGGVL